MANVSIKYARPPKHTRRYVVWGTDGGSLVYLVGYCPQSLSYYAGMFEDAKRVVPDIKPEDTTCGMVQKSRFVQGFTLMIIRIKGDRRDIQGFKECKWDDLGIDQY